MAATTGQKRRQISKGGFATRKAAEAALSEVLTQAAHGDVVVGGRGTLGDYLAEWLTGMRVSLAVSAWTNYRSVLALYVQPRIGDVRLSALTGSTLTALYGELLAGGGEDGRALSPTTVRLVHRVLTKALSDAVESRLLAANPAQHAQVPARRRTKMSIWNAQQAEAFLRSAAGDRLYAGWLLALACGLRRGELAGLRWADVDLEQQTLSVVSQRTTDADWQIVTKEPKGTSRRTIDLGGQAVAALRAHRRQSLSERLTWGSAYTDTGLVFVREDGAALHPARLTACSSAWPRTPAYRFSGCMTPDTPARYPLPPASTRRWCSSFSATPHGQPRWTCTRIGVDRLQKDAAARIESVVFAGARTE